MSRTVIALRLVVPALWLGLIIGLAFLEAPLKFQAPGITTALGLGIGRLVFFALEIASWVLLLVMSVLALRRPRISRTDWMLLAVTWVVMAVQTFVVRPPLNARSDIVIAGGDAGDSVLHYAYIVTDVALVVLLVWIIVRGARNLVLPDARAERGA
ncbi:hypothetical protein [Microbacterium gorillae]|uniref:hypothetical protein n=1 Tax=Microbacterium gorillae TaxID=1231063 RepID=UPI00058DE4B3|nr:hypothetical protein [Microbacterium gorillae]